MQRFHRSRSAAALGTALLLSTGACASASYVSPDPPRYTAGVSASPALAGALSEHVVVISIDGLRPDAIGEYGAGTLQRLMREGSYSLQARTILPSITLPSHTSMLTGVGPEVHGIDWNENRVETEGTVEAPTIFSLARAQGLRTAAFFSKGKFHHLLIPGSVDYAVAPRGNGKWLAGRTADHVAEYLETERPNLLFVHLGEPDFAGHTLGWMGSVYGWAVRRADAAVAEVLRAADGAFGDGNYTVLVTADHGGHGRTHGSDDPRDVTIPWIAWGKGVRQETELAEGIHTTDTAATALWLLGVGVPAGTEGSPVRDAFAAPPAVVGQGR